MRKKKNSLTIYKKNIAMTELYVKKRAVSKILIWKGKIYKESIIKET